RFCRSSLGHSTVGPAVSLERVPSAARHSRHTKEIFMEPAPKDDAHLKFTPPSPEWGALIWKLRWIGLDEEARDLELVVNMLPPEQRGSVSAGPFSTD